jgi:hypothetical protein
MPSQDPAGAELAGFSRRKARASRVRAAREGKARGRTSRGEPSRAVRVAGRRAAQIGLVFARFVTSGAWSLYPGRLPEVAMAKGIERGKKDNKPKLSTKEKQKKKKEKKATKG